MNIVVLGSGGWGTAAAMLLSDNGHTVALWSHCLLYTSDAADE